MEYRIVPDNQLHSNRAGYQPFWVTTQRLLDLWDPTTRIKKNSVTFLGRHCITHARGHWYFLIGRAYVEFRYNRVTVVWSGGRHRTRWLIDVGYGQRVPLAIKPSGIALARASALIERPVRPSDRLLLSITPDELPWE